MYSRRVQHGFTLIEAIMVIVITGILAGVVAVFITRPVQGYVDSVRRAELTDVADVALRRIGRDVRLALPNSLRVSGNSCIEFIMTKGGGR
jgi:MSHA biogenesis protein MshO